MDYEQAALVIASAKALPHCLLCGVNDWMPHGDLGNVLVHLPGATLDGTSLRATGATGGIVAFAWTCGNCGHIKLHSHTVLEQKLHDSETPS